MIGKMKITSTSTKMTCRNWDTSISSRWFAVLKIVTVHYLPWKIMLLFQFYIARLRWLQTKYNLNSQNDIITESPKYMILCSNIYVQIFCDSKYPGTFVGLILLPQCEKVIIWRVLTRQYNLMFPYVWSGFGEEN
jgi:hypothetical protein